MTRILILGGTAEARAIADALVAKHHDVTTSLAGVTTNPILPKGKIRTGGFGGAEGLQVFIKQNAITHVIDATHPYAAIISRNAADAVRATSALLLRFERPAWQSQAGDNWIAAATLADAAAKLPPQAKVLLTTGRKDIAPFLLRPDISGVIRTVEPPTETLPLSWHLLLDRPPHNLASEQALFTQHGITHLVTKNAGSVATRAKLDAARSLGIPVIMVQRPSKPPSTTFQEVDSLLAQF